MNICMISTNVMYSHVVILLLAMTAALTLLFVDIISISFDVYLHNSLASFCDLIKLCCAISVRNKRKIFLFFGSDSIDQRFEF